MYGRNVVFNKYVFFTESSYSFRCFQSDVKIITHHRLSDSGVVLLETISCEIDAPSFPWIFERCRRLA